MVKKIGYILIYIAVAGFFITAIANLLHSHYLGFLFIIISVIFLVVGGIVLLFNNISSPNASTEKMPAKKSTGTIFRFFTIVLVSTGLVMIVLDMRPAGIALFVVGLNLSVLGSIYRINRRNKKNGAITYSPFSLRLISVAIVLITAGLIFKIQHYSGGEIMLITGLVLSLICFILWFSESMRFNAGKTKRLQQAVTTVFYFSIVICITGLILSISHIHKTGLQLMTFSLVGIICACMLNIFTPVDISKVILTPALYRLNMIIKTMANLGLICVILTLLLKINRYPGVEPVYITAIITLLSAIIAANYLTKNRYLPDTRKKYPLLNAPIELTPSQLDNYTGIYYNEQLEMNITLAKNDTSMVLTARVNDRKPFSLAALDKNIFNFDPAGIILEFIPDERKFILVQYGSHFPFMEKI